MVPAGGGVHPPALGCLPQQPADDTPAALDRVSGDRHCRQGPWVTEYSRQAPRALSRRCMCLASARDVTHLSGVSNIQRSGEFMTSDRSRPRYDEYEATFFFHGNGQSTVVEWVRTVRLCGVWFSSQAVGRTVCSSPGTVQESEQGPLRGAPPRILPAYARASVRPLRLNSTIDLQQPQRWSPQLFVPTEREGVTQWGRG